MRDSQWCLWVTSAMRRQASWMELNCKGLISYFRQAGGVRKDRGSPPGSNLNRNWKQNKWEIAENVEVQIHRNVGQARHQHQWAVRGALEDGDKEDALAAADRGHGEEEEEMLPHVIKGNERLRPLLHSLLNFTNPSSKLFLVCPQSLFWINFSGKKKLWPKN